MPALRISGESCFSRLMKIDPATRALLIHAGVYLAVVALCAALALSHSPPRLWFVWVAAGWGIGLGAHALAVWLGRARHRRGLFRSPPVRGFAIHAFVYLGVVALLLAVNTAGGWHHYWSLWVALGWGLGVAAHGWAAFRRHEVQGRASADKSDAP